MKELGSALTTVSLLPRKTVVRGQETKLNLIQGAQTKKSNQIRRPSKDQPSKASYLINTLTQKLRAESRQTKSLAPKPDSASYRFTLRETPSRSLKNRKRLQAFESHRNQSDRTKLCLRIRCKRAVCQDRELIARIRHIRKLAFKKDNNL